MTQYNKRQRKMLKKVMRFAVSYTNDWLQDRAALKQCIARCSEGGRVLIVESGRDCDGAEWRDRTHTLPATVTHYVAGFMLRCDGADGPIYWDIDKPSRRAFYRASTRDLALEAFEDGHAHVIHSSL